MSSIILAAPSLSAGPSQLAVQIAHAHKYRPVTSDSLGALASADAGVLPAPDPDLEPEVDYRKG